MSRKNKKQEKPFEEMNLSEQAAVVAAKYEEAKPCPEEIISEIWWEKNLVSPRHRKQDWLS